jgi:hypothetical protein
MVYVSRGRRLIEHGGAIAGFNAALRHYPDEGVTVVVLANMNTRIAYDLARDLAAAAFGDADASIPRIAIALPAAKLEACVGVYEAAPGRRATVRLDDGVLTIQISGQPTQPLFAESETKFFVTEGNGGIEFLREASGRITHLVLDRNGRPRTLPRIAD